MPTLESHVFVKDTTEGRYLVANPYFHIVDTAGNQLPYIGEHDEVYINENEVRILKLVNAEVDYKSQSVQLPSAPILLDGREKGNYTIDLRPTVAMPVLSFNLTSEDPEKRKVFGDLRFRQAMSVAMNRGRDQRGGLLRAGPAQAVHRLLARAPTSSPTSGSSTTRSSIRTSPASSWTRRAWSTPTATGPRELPNGDKLVLSIQFSTQGISGKVVELVAQHWSDVGVQTTSKEVTPDEYRSAQSSNQLDVGAWEKGLPLAMVLGLNESFVAPFGDYFNHRTGMLWGEYLESDGAKGVQPPDWVYQMKDDIDAFQSTPVGTPESAEIGLRLVEKPDRAPGHDRHGARGEPGLSSQRAQELCRLQDPLVRVLLDLSVPWAPVVPGRRGLSPRILAETRRAGA